jgi:hypothetical protein
VVQNRLTGEIEVIGDYRAGPSVPDAEFVIDFTFHYPYRFDSPFAAYLVPRDIKVGERVLLEGPHRGLRRDPLESG